MRILIVANIPPFENGGAETQARFLAEQFYRMGHEVTVAGYKVDESFYNDFCFKIKRIKTIRLNKFTRGASFFVSLFTYILKNHHRFDVIYCRFLGEAAITISATKKLLGLRIPLIPCTACAGEAGDAKYIKELPFTKYVVDLINSECNVINNISPEIGDELKSIGIKGELMTYIPNGIDISNAPKRDRYSAIRKIVFLGRLAEQKGLIYLFDAAELMLDEGVNFELHLIGDGPDREVLEKYVCDSQLKSRVFFHGHIENNKILRYLNNFDIFVLPSLCEGFATAVIEAMLAGMPVVVTKSGGPNYFVDNNVGRVCDVKSSKCIKQSLIEFVQMSDGELEKIGLNGKNRVIERFDIRKIASQYLELFESLISKERS